MNNANKWQNGSLGLGDLLDRARAVAAVRDALQRGEFRGLLGNPTAPSRPIADDSRGLADGRNTTKPRATIDPSQRLLTVEDVAEQLQLKVSTVRAYAERGTLGCVRAGNRLRFRPSDVSLWIEQRHTKGET